MASPDNKHVATVIALGMPPPHMMGKGDEAESGGEADAEKQGAASGGEQALSDMFKKLQKGDTSGAYDDFMDATKQCMAALKMKDAEGSDAENKTEDKGESSADEGGDY